MAEWAEPLPDGVYLGLPAADYFAQETRGSSDWIKIHKAKWGWWWQSDYNPDRAVPKSPERVYGSALHAIMLEGVESYERAFVVEPDKAAYRDLMVTTEDMKSALIGEGLGMEGTSKFAKKDWARECRIHLAHRPCWENIWTDFEAELEARAAAGRPVETVPALEDKMIRLMRDIALDPNRTDNHEVRRLLSPPADEHPTLAEVSIFATVDGIRRRWRIDRMYPGLDMDLKSLGNWLGRPLPYEIGEVLARNGWDIQREDYHFGREQAYRLIREGKLFGGTIEQRRYIRQIAEENPEWDWVWLVYQKPDPKGRAPVIFPLIDRSWQEVFEKGVATKAPSDLRIWGRRKLDAAIDFYREAVATIGLDKPWASVEPLHYTDEGQINRIYMPHWIQTAAPTEAGAYNATSVADPTAPA